ncbi:MAG: hypothetical protein RLY70_3993 [Planctomycetota bacterium]
MLALRKNRPLGHPLRNIFTTTHLGEAVLLAAFGALAAIAVQTGIGRPPSLLAPAAEQPAATGRAAQERGTQERGTQERGPRGFFAGLRVGQSVTLKEANGRYELAVYDDVPLGPVGPKLADIGPDYVVVEDGVGVSETRIPIYSIKSIVRFKAFRR